MVGRETAARDDPLLTARPPGPRDGHSRRARHARRRSASESQLVRSAREVPVLVAVAHGAGGRPRAAARRPAARYSSPAGDTPAARLDALLTELGRRRMTNVLVEGGSRLLGSLLDARQIDEVHVFVAPKLFGGESAPAAIGGAGIAQLSGAGAGAANRRTPRRGRVHPCPRAAPSRGTGASLGYALA